MTTRFEETTAGQVMLGAQMLFVAFGALVLVPILTGLNPNVALFTAGAGTLLFQVITGFSVPVFLASSFAFIAPIIYGVQTWGIPATMGGLLASGMVYVALSGLIAVNGRGFIERTFPPIVVAPVIMVIGLSLAPVGVNMAKGLTGDGAVVLVESNHAVWISAVSLLVTVAVAVFAKGMLRLLPILCGALSGYALAFALGEVSFDAVAVAPWFAVPAFSAPELNWEAILYILPVAIAPAIEHIGDMSAISHAAKKDYLSKPGLHRTLLGDGLATALASGLGGPPNTTYSEVTGAVTLTKAFYPMVMVFAAVTAIALSFIGKVGAVLSTMPVPVMGGIMVLLFGTIAAVGMSTLVNSKDDLTAPRNLAIAAIALVCGLGGVVFSYGDFSLQGIGLTAIVAIVLNLVLPRVTTEGSAEA